MVGLAPTFVNLLAAWLVISRDRRPAQLKAVPVTASSDSRLIHLLEAALRVCSVSYQH